MYMKKISLFTTLILTVLEQSHHFIKASNYCNSSLYGGNYTDLTFPLSCCCAVQNNSHDFNPCTESRDFEKYGIPYDGANSCCLISTSHGVKIVPKKNITHSCNY